MKKEIAAFGHSKALLVTKVNLLNTKKKGDINEKG